MNVRKLLSKAALPWTLIGIVIAFHLIVHTFPDCPESGSYYIASPENTHAAYRYFYACGGATVGTTLNIDIDGHTVFSTYAAGLPSEYAMLSWKNENELHIIYPVTLDRVQTYESQYRDVAIKFSLISGAEPITKEEISAARKAAGY